MELELESLVGKRFFVKVDPRDTIAAVKRKIEEEYKEWPADQICLMIDKKVLVDKKTVDEYNIERRRTLTILRMRKAGIKRVKPEDVPRKQRK